MDCTSKGVPLHRRSGPRDLPTDVSPPIGEDEVTPQANENSPTVASSPDRRTHGRVHMQSGPLSVTQVDLGGGQFGTITDISEGGLAMQTIAAVAGDDFPSLCFHLSPFGNPIQPTTQVAWKSESKTTVGVRFLTLSPAERMELRSWIFTFLPLESSNPVVSSSPDPSETRSAGIRSFWPSSTAANG